MRTSSSIESGASEVSPLSPDLHFAHFASSGELSEADADAGEICEPSPSGSTAPDCRMKFASVDGEHELFGFLTTEANAIVAAIHPKAMPVILTSQAEIDRGLAGDTSEALALQRPLPDDTLRIVAKGEKEDGAS
jgi:putative SOS response-associated peptidase YedK